MKLIVAIFRPERLSEVLEALYRAEVRGLTVSRVEGHGGELERVETYRGTTVMMELQDKVRIRTRCGWRSASPTRSWSRP
jgi:nitrogen regulatory protein P-II 1